MKSYFSHLFVDSLFQPPMCFMWVSMRKCLFSWENVILTIPSLSTWSTRLVILLCLRGKLFGVLMNRRPKQLSSGYEPFLIHAKSKQLNSTEMSLIITFNFPLNR